MTLKIPTRDISQAMVITLRAFFSQQQTLFLKQSVKSDEDKQHIINKGHICRELFIIVLCGIIGELIQVERINMVLTWYRDHFRFQKSKLMLPRALLYKSSFEVGCK